MNKHIESITIKHLTDDSPDTSTLGEFSNRAESDFAINHRERGGSSREFEWFNPPVENYLGIGDEEIRKYCEQDYARARSLGDTWYYIGIKAEAEVVIAGVCQTVTSGGLWGIESDSDAGYFTEVEQEQLAELATILKEMGFVEAEIAEQAKNAEVSHV